MRVDVPGTGVPTTMDGWGATSRLWLGRRESDPSSVSGETGQTGSVGPVTENSP